MFGNQSRKAQHIREDLLRRNGHGVFEHCLNLLSDDELIRRHDQFHTEKLARMQAEAGKARRSQSGSLLIEMLLALAIGLTIAAIAVPSMFKYAAVNNGISAGSQLAAINLAETRYQGTYGAFINPLPTGTAPSALASFDLSVPIACNN